jgi:ADP-L-glycero-D-manno-heptose 6-epimerase
MKILVTGHKGFIGSNIALYLMSKGHEVEGWEWQPGIIPSTESYDWCIHTGAISSTTYTDVNQILEQNFEFSVRLAQVCENFGTKLQYASSASVYGPTENFVEDGPILPQSPYAWSKYLFDRFINQFIDEFQIQIQGFRYFNVYGQGEDNKGDQASPYTKFTKQAKEDNIITLFEDSDKYLRDFVCVNDIARIHEIMMGTDASGIFNIGTAQPVSFQEVADTIAQKHNAGINYIPIPDNIKSQYQKYTCADTTKLNQYIGDFKWTNIKDFINDTNN